MADKIKDVTAYCNPFTECAEVLHVNINKKRSLVEGAVTTGIVIVMSVLLFANSFWIFGIVSLLIAIVLFFVYRNMYLSSNPKMTIDKHGIMLDNKLYLWEEIDKIEVKEGQTDEGSDFLNIHLKDKRIVILTLDAYLDQRITTIANYIVKYF
jgi:hypothetical protein